MQSESKKQAKTKEELIALKKEVETLKAKLAELSEEELAQVAGGTPPELPATNLAESCYSNMEPGSVNLVKGSGIENGCPRDTLK